MLDFSKMTRTSKKEPVIDTINGLSDKTCPACGKQMLILKICCGAKNGGFVCNCGLKIYNE